MAYHTTRLTGVLGMAFGAILASCPPLRAAQPGGMDAAALKAQIGVMEAVINETLAQTFAPPFGVLEKAKGSYLPDFGVVFSLEVNLYPLRAPSPFNLRPLTQEELEKARKAKVDRIEKIKQTVPRLLADHASALRELSANDSIAVAVHLFYYQAEGDNLPSQVVMEVKKHDLEQLWDKQLSFDELRAKIRTLEL